MRPSITGDNRKITIYDIAAEAGVSASTVSRVLTGSARVNETKKERVLAAVEKYSFTPNALAKGLADAKSRMIGLLVERQKTRQEDLSGCHPYPIVLRS